MIKKRIIEFENEFPLQDRQLIATGNGNFTIIYPKMIYTFNLNESNLFILNKYSVKHKL